MKIFENFPWKNKLLRFSFSLSLVLSLSLLLQLFIFSTTDTPSAYSEFQEFFNKSYKIFSLNVPENLSFCDEKVPTESFYVRESIDREMLINTYWQSQTLIMIKKAHRWFPVIEPILKKNGIPDDFKYLTVIESGLSNVVSPAGATGFWQILKKTGEEYGLEINDEVDERYHVEKSTEVACKYLKDAYKKFGSWTMAAASYNMGISGLDKQAEKQKVNKYYDLYLNEETARYVFRILAVKEIFSSPKKYGFHIRKKDLYPLITTKQIEVDSAITNLADFAIANNANYKILKIFNPWLRQNTLSNKNRKKYNIAFPTEDFSDFLSEYYSDSSEDTIEAVDSVITNSSVAKIDTAVAISRKDTLKK
jgi:membrane-bound lytic murein transglycosylase D